MSELLAGYPAGLMSPAVAAAYLATTIQDELFRAHGSRERHWFGGRSWHIGVRLAFVLLDSKIFDSRSAAALE